MCGHHTYAGQSIGGTYGLVPEVDPVAPNHTYHSAMPQPSAFNLQILSPLSELSAMSINEVEGSVEPLNKDEVEVVNRPEADDDVDPMALRRIWDDNQIQKVYDLHAAWQQTSMEMLVLPINLCGSQRNQSSSSCGTVKRF
jgi:hypothetical protein